MDVKKRILLVLGVIGLLFSPLVLAAMDLEATRISIGESPPSIVYDQTQNLMDQKVYDALSIVVVDEDDNKIEFSEEDIELKYKNEIGSQAVMVAYMGNEDYKESEVTGKILITEPGKKNTRLVLKANPPAVGFVADRDVLEKEVYDDLCIVVVDEDANKIEFARGDIDLIFDHNIGKQAVSVNYKGNNTYNGAQALASVEITGKQDTKIGLTANPTPVKFTDDAGSLDTKVYDALGVQVMNVSDKKIDFSRSDIDISYNRAVGDQDVTVKYKGNDQFEVSTKTAMIKITGKENTTVSLSKSPMPTDYNSDSAVLDAAILAALKVKVLDSNQNEIKVLPEEIDISYNRQAGEQEVTIKYKGNDTYYESIGSQKVIIVNALETAIVMTANPPEVNFDKDLKKLDQAVYDDLSIAIRDVNNKEVAFEKKDIDLVYDKQIGNQKVTVKYKGNDNYKQSEATTYVKIVKGKEIEKIGIEVIVIVAVIVLAGIAFMVYRMNKKKQ